MKFGMEFTLVLMTITSIAITSQNAFAHDGHDHGTGDSSARVWKVLQVKQLNEKTRTVMLSKFVATNTPANTPGQPSIADSFEPFALLKAIKYRQDAQFFYVESNSIPDHRMMVGITAWQQQVPMPQPYFGDNAWRIPLEPVVAKNPLSANSHFVRGAIASPATIAKAVKLLS